jgi:peroxiredoxin
MDAPHPWTGQAQNHSEERTMKARTTMAGLGLALVAGVAAAQAPGAPAPVFTLNDTAGKAVALADQKGRYVVLEWTNPECPFVQKHYVSRNMQDLQKEWGAKGVVWLSVNSTNANHSEFKTPEQMASWMRAQGAAPSATLLDSTSATGRAYGARTTPQMFVIDPAGKVIYAGAIDDKRSANPADAKGANNYVRAALTEALAGKTVTTASTSPYGCSVKY